MSLASRAAIALGSNLFSSFGTPEDNVREAVLRLGALGRVLRVSEFLWTDPVGYLQQPRFLNGACLLETTLEPETLLQALLEIERGMGRVREGMPAKGPRVIDLDLIFYGDRVIKTVDLTLPHPAMAERRFVLQPLAEIAPEWVHPVTGRTVAEMRAAL